MSTRRGTQHLKRRRGLSHFTPPRSGENIDTATLLSAAANEADLQEAHQITHDKLIRQLGARRRGGIKWLDIPAAMAPEFLADEQATRLGQELIGHATANSADKATADLLAFLTANPEGYLVVTMCDAVR